MRAARGLLRAAQRLLPPAPEGTAVLAYHLVGAGTGSAVDLPSDLFQRHLDELTELAQPVDLAAAAGVARPPGGRPAGASAPADGRPAVAVTFDDAYGNFAERAWPLLAERGIPATLFVPVGFLEGDSPAPIRGTEHLPPVSWAELREMAETGLTVGSHTWSHPDLTRLPMRFWL